MSTSNIKNKKRKKTGTCLWYSSFTWSSFPFSFFRPCPCISPCKYRLCYHTGENICIDSWIHEGLLPLHGSCSSYSHTWVCKSNPWAVDLRHRTDVTKISSLLLSYIFIDVVPSNHFHNCTYSNDIIYYWKAGSSEEVVATVSHTKQHHTTIHCRKCSASEKKHNQPQHCAAIQLRDSEHWLPSTALPGSILGLFPESYKPRSNEIWSST